MPEREPIVELHDEFSSEGAIATPWFDARLVLETAEIYWISTVRPDGRPHVTPLIGVWVEGSMYFCTGADERKARNLAVSSPCILTTGCNRSRSGLDVVLEGDAVRVVDDSHLQRLADAYESKYGSEWHFDVSDGAFVGDGHRALVFEVSPVVAHSYARGDASSETRYGFSSDD